jgi:hypothetical protein
VLDRFNTRFLKGCGYDYSVRKPGIACVHNAPMCSCFSKLARQVLLDSHDPRFIDIALLSRFPIANIRTHKVRIPAGSRLDVTAAMQDEKSKMEKDAYLFSRGTALFASWFAFMTSGLPLCRLFGSGNPGARHRLDCLCKLAGCDHY